MALESGLGSFSFDQISTLFYQNSIDFDVKVTPFSRVINASTDRDGAKVLLEVIHLYFKQHQFTQTAFENVVRQTKETLDKQSWDDAFEAASMAINTDHFFSLQPLSPKDLSLVKQQDAQDFFNTFVANPADYTCIVVGNFDTQKMSEMIKQYLGTLQVPTSRQPLIRANLPPFPKGTITHEIPLPGRTASYARLTIPIQIKITEKNIQAVELLTLMIEAQLRSVIRKSLSSTQGIDVSYEMPMYPYLDHPWLVLQYHAEPRIVLKIKESILSTLDNMRKKELDADIFSSAISDLKSSDDFWTKNNEFWLSSLANYCLWEWNSQGIGKAYDPIDAMKPAQIQGIVRDFIPENNYTFVYTQR